MHRELELRVEEICQGKEEETAEVKRRYIQVTEDIDMECK